MNDILEKAIKCIDQTTAHSEVTKDSAELFGKYIASELRILTPDGQHWVNALFSKYTFHRCTIRD